MLTITYSDNSILQQKCSLHILSDNINYHYNECEKINLKIKSILWEI